MYRQAAMYTLLAFTEIAVLGELFLQFVSITFWFVIFSLFFYLLFFNWSLNNEYVQREAEDHLSNVLEYIMYILV